MIVERIKSYDTMKPNNKITKNNPKMQKPSSTLHSFYYKKKKKKNFEEKFGLSEIPVGERQPKRKKTKNTKNGLKRIAITETKLAAGTTTKKEESCPNSNKPRQILWKGSRSATKHRNILCTPFFLFQIQKYM